MWANRKFVVSATEAEEDGILHLINGDTDVFKGNMICVNQLGETLVMPKDYFERNYIEIEKVKKKVDINQMSENYRQNWDTLEEEDYIDRFQETVKERNNLDNN